MTTNTKGIIYAASAYTLWGLLPIYWKLVKIVPAFEILCHRMVWSLGFMLLILALRQHWQWLLKTLKTPSIILIFLGSAIILALNWFTFIWAVTHGFVIETSLGYFINPLITVLLGVIFLRESLRRWQLMAILIATGGVLYLTISYGAFPWIALTLAFTFGIYGLIRKTAPLDVLEGLSLETILLFLPALAYLIFLEFKGDASFGHIHWQISFFLSLAGVATALPLLLFSMGARRITMTNLGFLHYIAPTLQFLLGVFVYREDFNRTRLIGFSIIWLALIIYTAEGVMRRRALSKTKKQAP